MFRVRTNGFITPGFDINHMYDVDDRLEKLVTWYKSEKTVHASVGVNKLGSLSVLSLQFFILYVYIRLRL